LSKKENLPIPGDLSPFERIRRTNAAGAEYWSSRDFAAVLTYSDYRNFEQVIRSQWLFGDSFIAAPHTSSIMHSSYITTFKMYANSWL
jgi:hypothetical protein